MDENKEKRELIKALLNVLTDLVCFILILIYLFKYNFKNGLSSEFFIVVFLYIIALNTNKTKTK